MTDTQRERAYAPHCDSSVLHAPGACRYCDHYPDWQAYRQVAQINFTGEHDPDKSIDPAEARRPLELINRWGGNRVEARTDVEINRDHDAYWAEVRRLMAKPPKPRPLGFRLVDWLLERFGA